MYLVVLGTSGVTLDSRVDAGHDMAPLDIKSGGGWERERGGKRERERDC